jgi:hypothetical protein
MFLDLEVNRSLSQESAFFNILIEDASKAKGRLEQPGRRFGDAPRRESGIVKRERHASASPH